MKLFENIIVTEIKPPIIVHSEKGKKFHISNRPTFGLSLCSEGQITYIINNQKITASKDMAIILPSGSSYELIGDKNGIFPLINFMCEKFHCNDILTLHLNNPDICIKTLNNIKTLSQTSENRLEVYSEFYKLLNQIAIDDLSQTNILIPAVKYIHQNLSNTSLSNTQLAKLINISEVYLRKLFLKHYEVTPKQFILNARIQKAKQLLTDTSLSVTQITFECGFSTPYHFCKIFKQKTGLTPLEYSKQNKVFEI